MAIREFHQRQGVGHRALEGDVPGDRSDGPDLELVWRCQGRQDGDGVVLTGVGVDDDGPGDDG
jgi:hypothetical protein